MAGFKHIFWDWNGTLFNDIDITIQAVNHVLDLRQYPRITKEQYRSYYAHPVTLIYERAGVDLNLHSFQKLTDDWYDFYSKRFNLIPLHDGTEEILEYFKQAGSMQSVLSALPQDILINFIENHKLSSYFVEIFGLLDREGKSKVERGFELQTKLGVKSKDLLVIGDSDHDYEVAKALEAKCVLIARGLQSEVQLLKCDCPVVQDFNELKSILSKI